MPASRDGRRSDLRRRAAEDDLQDAFQVHMTVVGSKVPISGDGDGDDEGASSTVSSPDRYRGRLQATQHNRKNRRAGSIIQTVEEDVGSCRESAPATRTINDEVPRRKPRVSSPRTLRFQEMDATRPSRSKSPQKRQLCPSNNDNAHHLSEKSSSKLERGNRHQNLSDEDLAVVRRLLQGSPQGRSKTEPDWRASSADNGAKGSRSAGENKSAYDYVLQGSPHGISKMGPASKASLADKGTKGSRSASVNKSSYGYVFHQSHQGRSKMGPASKDSSAGNGNGAKGSGYAENQSAYDCIKRAEQSYQAVNRDDENSITEAEDAITCPPSDAYENVDTTEPEVTTTEPEVTTTRNPSRVSGILREGIKASKSMTGRLSECFVQAAEAYTVECGTDHTVDRHVVRAANYDCRAADFGRRGADYSSPAADYSGRASDCGGRIADCGGRVADCGGRVAGRSGRSTDRGGGRGGRTAHRGARAAHRGGREAETPDDIDVADDDAAENYAVEDLESMTSDTSTSAISVLASIAPTDEMNHHTRFLRMRQLRQQETSFVRARGRSRASSGRPNHTRGQTTFPSTFAGGRPQELSPPRSMIRNPQAMPSSPTHNGAMGQQRQPRTVRERTIFEASRSSDEFSERNAIRASDGRGHAQREHLGVQNTGPTRRHEYDQRRTRRQGATAAPLPVNLPHRATQQSRILTSASSTNNDVDANKRTQYEVEANRRLAEELRTLKTEIAWLNMSLNQLEKSQPDKLSNSRNPQSPGAQELADLQTLRSEMDDLRSQLADATATRFATRSELSQLKAERDEAFTKSRHFSGELERLRKQLRVIDDPSNHVDIQSASENQRNSSEATSDLDSKSPRNSREATQRIAREETRRELGEATHTHKKPPARFDFSASDLEMEESVDVMLDSDSDASNDSDADNSRYILDQMIEELAQSNADIIRRAAVHLQERRLDEERGI